MGPLCLTTSRHRKLSELGRVQKLLRAPAVVVDAAEPDSAQRPDFGIEGSNASAGGRPVSC